eukprot:g8925.t1
MAPKKKNQNKKAPTGDGGDAHDGKNSPQTSDVQDIAVANIVVGLIVNVEKVPNGTLLKVLVEVPDREDEVFIITNAKVEEGMKVITAIAPVPLPNGVEVATIGGFDSEGMFCGPRELLWPTTAFRADMPIILPQAEVGPVPSYDECLILKNKPKEDQTGKMKKKGGKKKGASGGNDEEEDEFEAALKAFGVVEERKDGGVGNKRKEKPASNKPPAAAASSAPAAPAAPAPAADDDDDDDNVDESQLTAKQLANRKKKEAKKRKEQEKKEEEKRKAEQEAAKEDDSPGGAAGAANKKKKGGVGKLLAAQLAKQAELEKAQLEKRREEQARLDEEDKKLEAEEEAKAEKERKKKEDKQKRIEEQKRLGTYLTAAQKRQQAEAAKMREALGLDAGVGREKATESTKGPELIEVTLTQELKNFYKKKLSFKKKEWVVDAPLPAGVEESADVRKGDALFQVKSDENAKVTDKKFGLGLYPVDGSCVLVFKRVAKVNQAALFDQGGKKKKNDMKVEDVTSTEESTKAEGMKTTEEEVEKEKTPAAKVVVPSDSDDDWEKDLDTEDEKEKAEKEAAENKAAAAAKQKAAAKAAARGPQSDDGSDDDKDSDDNSNSDDNSDSDDNSSSDSDEYLGLRSPIVCIMGHVDTGKTKLLDKIRRTNVQDGEAGGITQQIGATFFPETSLTEQLVKVNAEYELEVPGLLIIDTPGHESFNNLRKRGSSLADLAILVIDIMHGLEPQTIESLEMLKQRRCNFVIALNKVDRLYDWDSKSYVAFKGSFEGQPKHTQSEFWDRFGKIQTQLAEKGLNTYLYWENPNIKQNVSVIPTSAITGEGVPDLLYMIIRLGQEAMSRRLEIRKQLECTILEVKTIEGLGTTMDVVLVNGELNKNDTIVVPGTNGPIVTQVRALLTPQPLREMRVKGDYINHRRIDTSMGIKICAPGLENALAGASLRVCNDPDQVENVKEEVEEEFEEAVNAFEKEDLGVYVMASTLGSLEALLAYLKSVDIPVFQANIGVVHKKDVKKAAIMRDKGKPEYAVILAFDVKVDADARKEADRSGGVNIFTADIIYHLFDQFTKYMDNIKELKKKEKSDEAVFPCVLKIIPQYVFNKKNPIIVGVDVVEGVVKVGTLLCLPEQDMLEIGRITSVEKDKKPVDKAVKGESVCVKIQPNALQSHIVLGRHFSVTQALYSKITRASIDCLKEHYKDEMSQENWKLVITLKKVFGIS